MSIQSITTLCFKPFALDRALEGAAAAGFGHVEMCAVKGFLEHVDPDDVSPGSIARVRSALEGCNVHASSLSGHSDLATRGGLARHRRLLRVCSELGIEVLNTFAGSERRTSAQRRSFVKSARVLGDEAAELGMVVCVENDGAEAGTGEEVAALLAEIDHEAVRMNYDPANASFFGGVEPEADLLFALPWLGHFHLKDKRGGKDVADFPPLGEGELDLPRILDVVVSSGYNGPVCLEIEFDGTWPDWDSCVGAATRSKARWDAILGNDGAR
jgi:L-ribulose-5-phosphate 3-epimerase